MLSHNKSAGKVLEETFVRLGGKHLGQWTTQAVYYPINERLRVTDLKIMQCIHAYAQCLGTVNIEQYISKQKGEHPKKLTRFRYLS